MATVASETRPDPDAVWAQLECLFGDSAFKNSRRSQALLRHVVEHYLEGGADHPKERSLGIEVFGRDADYDTGSDPVVRVVAGDIRKRIAQYYHEPGHEHELRIDLPAGSYAPVFHPPAVIPSAPDVEHVISNEPAQFPVQFKDLAQDATPPPPPVVRWGRYCTLAAAFLVGLGIGALAWKSLPAAPSVAAAPALGSTALGRFWGPIIAAHGLVQIEIGTSSQTASRGARDGFFGMVGWPNMIAASQVIMFFQESRKAYKLENANTSNLNALTQGPAVLIGGSNNPWTVALSDSLRFHFVRQKETRWIADRDDPDKKFLNALGTIPGSVRQYALIARLFSPVTGQQIVVIAGMGTPATRFASKFLTSADDMAELARQLPKGWESKNIEAVISGQALGGAPGAAHVVAVETW